MYRAEFVQASGEGRFIRNERNMAAEEIQESDKLKELKEKLSGMPVHVEREPVDRDDDDDPVVEKKADQPASQTVEKKPEPAQAAPAETATVEAKTDEIENPYPKGSKEHTGWAKLRIKAEEGEATKRELDDLKKQFDEFRKAVPATPPQAQPQAPHVPEEQVFDMLADARNERYTNAAQNRTVTDNARIVINGMAPDKILGVLEKAERGELGANSDEIAGLARDALLKANARVAQESTKQQETQKRSADYQQKVNESSARISAKYPELNPKTNADFSKFLDVWRLNNLGIDKQGKQANKDAPFAFMTTPQFLQANPDWPEKFGEMAKRDFDYERLKVTTTAADAKTKKEELARQPEVNSHRSAGAGGQTRLQQLREQLKGMPVGS